MGIQLKNSTSWVALDNAYANVGGSWTQVKQIFVRRDSDWVSVWEHLIVSSVSENTINLDASTLFTSAVWTSNTPKEIIVDAGVTIGSMAPANAALTIPDTWGGILTIRNRGKIYGAGGAANGGAGGHAINNNKAGLIVINESGAEIRGGGGGGGGGGKGGNSTKTVVVREPTTGQYQDSAHCVRTRGNEWFWGSTSRFAASSSGSVTSGGYTYYRGTRWATERWTSGSEDQNQHSADILGIYRTNNTTVASAGGNGGAGGRGQGYNQSLDNGAPGQNGDTNAGTGGTGGAGGIWGTAGSAGQPGLNGTVTNGSTGSQGGAAGAAITGASRTVTNTGTISGAY